MKEEVSCVKGEIVEMRSEMRSLLGKIYEAIKMLALLCVVIFVVCVVILYILRWCCNVVFGLYLCFAKLCCNFIESMLWNEAKLA